ncbi:hypothetical protein, partial [Paenibacillus riograndensis]|uniref:hypothetical protein n=1 Tax=Paenibacillus riograndensis TaxID=483937 RepID=UPI000AA1F23A
NPFRGSRKSSAVGEPFDALLGLASNKGFQPQSKPPVIRVVLISGKFHMIEGRLDLDVIL